MSRSKTSVILGAVVVLVPLLAMACAGPEPPSSSAIIPPVPNLTTTGSRGLLSRTFPPANAPLAAPTATPTATPTVEPSREAEPPPTATPSSPAQPPTRIPPIVPSPSPEASAEGCLEQSKPPVQIEGPGELQGAVCGKPQTERVILRLLPLLETGGYGNPVIELIVGEGQWELTGITVEPGRYALHADTGQPDTATMPGNYAIEVPEVGVVWRHDNLVFRVRSEESPPPGLGVTAIMWRVKISGSLAGLDGLDTAIVEVYNNGALPSCEMLDTQDETVCPSLAEPIDATDVDESDLLATFSITGSRWGLLGHGLRPGRYTIVVRSDDYEVTPGAYDIQLPAQHRFPPRLEGIDFTFQRRTS